jgi:hypothetical protein
MAARRGRGPEHGDRESWVNSGYVYILTNDAMPGIVKIGRTSRDVDLRASELWQTGVPQPFEVYWQFKTPDCVQLEGFAHRDLRKHRVSKAREFFRVEPEYAVERCRFWAGLQAHEWVDQQFSEYLALHYSEVAAVSGIENLAETAGLDRRLVAEALGIVTIEELLPAIERARGQRRAEHFDVLRMAGIPEDQWWEPGE